MEPDELNRELAVMVMAAAARFQISTGRVPNVVILPLEFMGRGLTAIGDLGIFYGQVASPVAGVRS